MKISDKACAALFFTFGIFLFLSIPSQVSSSHNDSLGPRFVPYAVAAAFVLISILVWVGSIGKEAAKTDAKSELRVLCFIAVTVLSIVLLSQFGFLVGMLFLSVFTLWLLQVKTVKWYLIVGAVLAFVYLFFTYVLSIALP